MHLYTLTRRMSRHVMLAITTVLISPVVSFPVLAQGGNEVEPLPTVVLVHGAFAESASWNAVISHLQGSGYTAIATPNPLQGLSSDAQRVADVLKSIDGPIILVGHSYGGAVASNAALGNKKVKALVFVAGFAPDEGENIGELSNRFPGSTLGETLTTVPLADGTTDLYIQQDRYHQQFAADLPAYVAMTAAATQRPLRDTALNEGSGVPAWKDIPSWFVIPELDYNIPPVAQRFMAERAKAREVVGIVGASHSVPISHADEVADVIIRAANLTK